MKNGWLLVLLILVTPAAANAQAAFQLKFQFPAGQRPPAETVLNDVSFPFDFDWNEDGIAELSLLREDAEGNLAALEIIDGETFVPILQIAYEPVWNGRRQRLTEDLVGDGHAAYDVDFEAAYTGKQAAAPDARNDGGTFIPIPAPLPVAGGRSLAARITDEGDLAFRGFHHLNDDGKKELLIAGDGVVILDHEGQSEVARLGAAVRYLGLVDMEDDGIREVVVFDTGARRVQVWGWN